MVCLDLRTQRGLRRARRGMRLRPGEESCFLDGNKRVAFVATNVFLIMNGLEIEAPEPEVVDTMLRVAEGRTDRDAFVAWIRTVSVPCKQ